MEKIVSSLLKKTRLNISGCRVLNCVMLYLRGLIFFLLSLPFGLTAQIQITVFDQDLKSLQGAVLMAERPSIKMVSDVSGKFLLAADRIETVTISHVAYESVTLSNLSSGNYEVALNPKTYVLNAVEVEAFGNKTDLAKVAGAIRKFDAVELDRFDQQSLVRPLNLTPGIRFEERAGASYRVSIRGSSLRSPFGVRNVKVYWNNIPFTDPGGNTFLNLLDRQNMNGLEVIKGPAGSMFGAGTGGVMRFQSTNYAPLNNSINVQMSMGSFGLFRFGAQANSTNENASWTAKFSRHQADNYRQHNRMERNVFELGGLLFASQKRDIDLSLLFTDLYYEIPGGLTREQFDEDPTQARPRSSEQNASIDHQMFLLKLGQEYRLNTAWKNNTSLFGSYREFENPFILDYKQDDEFRVGGRTVFEYTNSPEKFALFLGGEYQAAWLNADNFGNVGGAKDTIRFSDELFNQDLIAFINAQYFLTSSWKLEGGLSVASASYHINRKIDRINNNPQEFTKRFETSVNPRIALSKVFNNRLSAHLSISTGYSVPTSLEIRTNEGSLNTALEPERGINYEFNFRGGDDFLSYDLSLFRFDLNESITTFTNAEGVVLFRNAGSLKQQGVEVEISKPWIVEGSGFFARLNSRMSLTYHDFQFNDYLSGGDDLSGNALTGTAPFILGFTTDAKIAKGFFINVSYLYTDPIPLNDENTVYADAYQMLFAKVGWEKKWPSLVSSLSFGVDNVLDQEYSLGNDLNAFGRRYFQPAPTRNFTVDLNIRFRK